MPSYLDDIDDGIRSDQMQMLGSETITTKMMQCVDDMPMFPYKEHKIRKALHSLWTQPLSQPRTMDLLDRCVVLI
ncbi:hypothetical protein [Variovorax soli]|uniref:Uncharacterized protein n=1 Tax=Variovorax soli TaxID=376815 RepID=A0ABU1NK74_9BURK|nr:hypothetical protein [Variovorax soli]MDR6538842.1 hypothetical protein [Variovorax soli]